MAKISLLCRVTGLSLRNGVRNFSRTADPEGAQNRAPAPLHWKEPAKDGSWEPSLETFQAHPTRRRPKSRPRTCWMDCTSHLPWELPGIHRGSWKALLGRGNSEMCFLAATVTQSQKSRRGSFLDSVFSCDWLKAGKISNITSLIN